MSTTTMATAEVFYFETFDDLSLGPIAGPDGLECTHQRGKLEK